MKGNLSGVCLDCAAGKLQPEERNALHVPCKHASLLGCCLLSFQELAQSVHQQRSVLLSKNGRGGATDKEKCGTLQLYDSTMSLVCK